MRLTEASKEQACYHQHQQRQGGLGGYKRVAKPATDAGTRNPAKHRLRIEARERHCRRCAKDQTGHESQQHGEGETYSVRAGLKPDWNGADHWHRT